jgi:type IV secretion system protein VirB11
MADGASSYLDIYLTPFLVQLERPDVSDIYVNRPGEIWVETLDGRTERQAAPELGEALLWRLARQVASVTHQGVSREHPLLAARLPDGARVQIVAPPATRGPMAIAIRKHVSADLSLADYESSGAFSNTRGGDENGCSRSRAQTVVQDRRWAHFLVAAVRARKTIVLPAGRRLERRRSSMRCCVRSIRRSG